MTRLDDILAQTQALSPQERKELIKRLIDTLEVEATPSRLKTGAEIVAHLEAIGPIELVDPHIDDPTEWVKAQRQKRAKRRFNPSDR